MNSGWVYLIAGGLIAYVIFATPVKKKKSEGSEDEIKDQRDFDFTFAEERDAFYKAYSVKYPLGISPKEGDVLKVEWKQSGTNYFKISNFKYSNSLWSRVQSSVLEPQVKLGKPQRKPKETGGEIKPIE